MGDDLGERLVRAGLLTRSALGEALDATPAHGAALLRELVESGVPEDALAGFFVAEGFGPLLEARDLALADPSIAERVPAQMAWEFLVLPVRSTSAGVVVAMATPSDPHILSETRRALGAEVVATAARAGDIETAIRAQRPEAQAFEPPGRAPGTARHDSEPPVLELTRRRGPAPTPGYQSRLPPGGEAPAGKLGPRVSIAPDAAEPDAEAPLLLVRHKAVPRGATPSGGLVRTMDAAEGSRPSIPLASPQRTFSRPKPGPGERSPTGEYENAGRAATSEASAAEPAAPVAGSARESIHEALRSLTPSKPITRPPASALGAAAPVGTATAEAEARASSGASQPGMPRVGSPRSTSPGMPRPPASALAPKTSRLSTRPGATPAAPEGGAKWARGGVRGGSSISPAGRPSASLPPAARPSAAPAPSPPPAPVPEGPLGGEPSATLPPPAGSSEDRWDIPGAASAARDNKVSRGSTVSSKAPAGDVGPVLAAIRAARDRDAVVRLACDGAVTVSRAAVFLALKKGVLKGWDGAGSGISRDSVRNLWIPAGSASMFKRVLDEGVAYVGPYGTGIADGLFKAAVGSRGGDVMVQPVLLEQKVVGLLCIDDLRPGPLARGRIESLANAVGEAFRRVISAGKAD